jgi:hypothetical protein
MKLDHYRGSHNFISFEESCARNSLDGSDADF